MDIHVADQNETVLKNRPENPEALVIGISARALFDLEKENAVFENEGLEAYRAYQREHEEEVLDPGTAFHLVLGLLGLNKATAKEDANLVEVVIMTSNSPDLSLRIFKSIEHYGLEITRAVFSSGAPLHSFYHAYKIDLLLSRSELDVHQAVSSGIAGAVLYSPPEGYAPEDDEIRIAFDGDAVLFSEEAELIYKEHGLDAFIQHEREKAREALPEGPFAKLLKTLSYLQSRKSIGRDKLQLALVTARSNATHERVIRTLREWGVYIDQAFFLGGMPKDKILREFRPHIFFDDQDVHGLPASKVAPAGKVPYLGASIDKNATSEKSRKI